MILCACDVVCVFGVCVCWGGGCKCIDVSPADVEELKVKLD